MSLRSRWCRRKWR